MPDYTLPQARKVEGLHPTAIEWTDYSANPLRAVTREGKAGWACQKVATGCMHCYAEAVNIRFGTGLPFSAAGMKDVRVVLDERRVAAMLNAKPRGPCRAPDGRPKVFVCDMTDLFGEWVPFDVIDRLFALFALRQDIDWQVLTKRPERMAAYLGDEYPLRSRVRDAMVDMTGDAFSIYETWPLPNVWLGCSASTQADLDANVPHLLRCPAAVRFLSLEPLVEHIDMRQVPYLKGHMLARGREGWQVIVGGESGPRARSCDVDWIRSVVQQCGEVNVPCFVKQFGSRAIACAGPLPAPQSAESIIRHGEYDPDPIEYSFKDPKGGDPSEWPEDLRVRQWPERKENTNG